MISEFEKILNNSSDLKSVEMTLLAYLEKVRKIEKRERIGFVSGSVFSDGEENVKRNIKILHNRTEKVRKTHNFPIFSAYDVLYNGLFWKLPESRLPFEKRRPLFFGFWKRVMECGYVTDMFMSPGWEKSVGAVKEHESAVKMEMRVCYLNN